MSKVDDIQYNPTDIMVNRIIAKLKNTSDYFTQSNIGIATNIVFSLQKLMNLASPDKIASYIDV